MTISYPSQKGIQVRPLFITIGIHVLLLLFFLWWHYNLPQPVVTVPDMGMEVNLGSSPDGSGTDQPMDVDDPAAMAATTHAHAAQSSASSAEIERTNEEDAPSLANNNATNRRQDQHNSSNRQTGSTGMPNTSPKAQPAPKPRYVYQGGTGRGGNSAAVNHPGSSEGNTTGPGDRGVPGGTPGASNYTGTPGTGTGGISYKLDGRSIVAFPPREARFREGGRVVVRVTVDRNGEIVNKQIISSTNTELSPIALHKLQQVRFNKSESAPAEQFGNITFEFKTGQ